MYEGITNLQTGLYKFIQEFNMLGEESKYSKTHTSDK